MKVQKVVLSAKDHVTWMLLGDDFLPIEPVQEFLDYLRNIERSPNTIRAYAFHLKLYWEYLNSRNIDWTEVGIVQLADFMSWLRLPSSEKIVTMHEQEARRTEATVNAILTSVCMFYDFQEKLGNAPHIPLYRSQFMPRHRYKGFLHHITKSKPVRTRLLKLKVPKRAPKTLEDGQIELLIDACQRVRDKFLLCLLHESGMRIGQALGLRHEDIQSWDNVIQIVPRNDNTNGARAKSLNTYSLSVTKELMGLYTQYIQDEFMEILGDDLSDYVFANLWDGVIGAPMTYNAVMDLFRRLKRKTGIAIHPHMLRHTHATELIRQGMGMAFVQKRLGHASIQTTIDTYVHVTDEDMKEAYQDYLEQRDLDNDATIRKPNTIDTDIG
ncbi:MAG: tyrosine-type recombinase/integrase [Cyanobacteria bacterium P01_E01_bin.6]